MNSSRCPEGHEERLHGIDEQGAHEPGSDIHYKPTLGNAQTLVVAVRNVAPRTGCRPGLPDRRWDDNPTWGANLAHWEL